MTNLSLEQEVQRLEDVRTIKNLMGTYTQYELLGKRDETEELFAMKTPGLRAEISNLGVWEGVEGIKRLIKAIKKQDGDRIGILNTHAICNAVIEVAEDGKTGKGLWLAPSYETYKVGGQPKAYLSWCKYGVDFIKEEGKWKIWHLHMYIIFRIPSEAGKTFIDNDRKAYPVMDVSGELKPGKPPTVSIEYRVDAIQEFIPIPPSPYKTFDEKTAY